MSTASSRFPPGTDGRIAFRRFNAIDLRAEAPRQRGGRLDRDRSPQDKISAVCRRLPGVAPMGAHLTIVTGSEEDTKQPPSISQLDIATGAHRACGCSPLALHRNDRLAARWQRHGDLRGRSSAATQLWFVPEKGGHAKKIRRTSRCTSEVSVTSDSQTLAAHRAENPSISGSSRSIIPRSPRLTTGLGNYLGTGACVGSRIASLSTTVFSGEGTPSLKV